MVLTLVPQEFFMYAGGCLTPPFANPGVAEKAPWLSLQSGVAGVYSL